MFDFSASLSDVAPVSPMPLSVDFMKMKELIVDECHLCVVPFMSTVQREFCGYCV